MIEEDKKALEDKEMKALSEVEIEGVAGGAGIGGGAKGGAIYNATGQPVAECVRQA